MIYLDNAATTITKPQSVIDAVVKAMTTMGNSGRGVHAASLDASRAIYATREKLAAFFDCPRSDHVVFTANSTEALNIAICGLLSPGDHVISTDLEHNSVLRPLYRLEQHGVTASFVSADHQGNINYQEFQRLMQPNTKAIVCTHASNLTGTLLQLETIAQIAHQHGALLIVDASQTAGARPISMLAMGIDVLCFTGHKGLLGPQGTGGLCIMPGVDLRPWKVGGTGVQTHLRQQPLQMPIRLEAGTLNGHGIAGLGAAVDYIQSVGIEQIQAKEHALMQQFYQGIRDIEGIKIYGDFTADRAPIVAMNLGELDSAQVADELSERFGIATRPGAHCAPRLHNALGTTDQGAVRFSFGWFNTLQEVQQAIDAVKRIAEE